MKIDLHRNGLEPDSASRLEQARRAESSAAVQKARADKPEKAEDAVQVSDAAKLLSRALNAADTPTVRRELVDKMRELLKSGQIGQDSRALADRMIDDIIETGFPRG